LDGARSPVSRLAAGHPAGAWPWCRRGRRHAVRGAWGWEGPWGRGRGQRVVGRRVVEADMRGLVTAGPCVRLERCAGL